jgi:hypothetical protein
MTPTQSNDSLECFIRGELGCRCPAAVFRDIALERCPPLFGDWPDGWLVSVGNRLLILVLRCDDCVAMQRSLGLLREAGRRLRDAHGYNRFRLVVATSRPDDMALSLAPYFENPQGGDERLHLHVVAAARVPDLPAQWSSSGPGG